MEKKKYKKYKKYKKFVLQSVPQAEYKYNYVFIK